MLLSRDMATKPRFQFRLRPGWETQYIDHAERGIHDVDTIRANMRQAFVQDFSAQLNDEYRDRSSPDYHKYQKYISEVAFLFGETFELHLVHKHGIILDKPLDEHFDILGCRWVRYDQFEEALSAFNICVEISKREGCWWPQKLCARYIHLAFVHMALDNKQEQLRASMHGAAFAVASKNSGSDSITCPSFVFNLSFLNLAAQFVGFNPDDDIKNRFIEDTLQAWEECVAERRDALQEKLDAGKQEATSEVDLCFALADFLVHSNRNLLKTMLENLKSSLPASVSSSELVQICDLATRESKLLIKTSQMDALNMTRDAKKGEELRTNLNFVLDLLEVASTFDPSSDQCAGWSISSKPMVNLYTDERGVPCYPGLCFLLFIEQDSTPNAFVSDCEQATRDAGLIATPVIAEGSNYEEFAALLKGLGSKKWNLNDPSDFQEFANMGRDLGLWATSSSTVAVAPVYNIEIALHTVFTMADTIRHYPLYYQAAKSMLRGVVLQLTDQFNPEVGGGSMKILLQYAHICDELCDTEERVNCCMKALRLAEKHNIHKFKLGFHYLLGVTYTSLGNGTQAKKELKIARDIMESYPDITEWEFFLEVAEGNLELVEYKNAPNGTLAGEHCDSALRKLTSSLEVLEKSRDSSRESYTFEFNFMSISFGICEALQFRFMYPEAQAVCIKAFEGARKLKLTNELKFSKKLRLKTTEVASQCGYLAQLMGNFISAEGFYREGLQELQELSELGYYVDEFMFGKLYGGLGRTLLMQLQDKLSEAEDTLRKAVDACSRSLMKRDLSSQARIIAFGLLQHCYNDLQLCLYATYMQAAECERGVISVEALVAAERGRCLDLAFNLEVLKSRITGDENVSIDHNVDELNYEKFNTKTDYAWEHLKNCMAKCTDAMKEQNPEVQRVAFVEYTLTNQLMLIWVLHSCGTQEPSTSQETSLPSMYAVEVKTKFKEFVSDHRHFEDDFKWIYEPHAWDFHRDHILQVRQAGEAVLLFENLIEQLRKDHEPGIRKLNALYELLISPIAHKLVTGEPVIFIPHEGLSFVPFAALKPKATKTKGSQQKELRPKHLIEDHPIGYAASLRTLGWATNQYITLKANTKPARNPVLLVADPFPLGVKKDSLKDAIEEVNKITEMLPPESTVTLKREQATLKNVTSAMTTSSWFHIACHGEVSPELYPQGVLFMSCSGVSVPDVEDSPNCSDSMMYDTVHSSSSEVDLECKLPKHCRFTPETLTDDVKYMAAQAVVLSACKVGQGKKTSEGLLGLSRAFMQAGVPLVIAPLRTLDSRLGSAFMQTMYRRMVAGESVIFALRNTMIDVIKKKIDVLDEKENDDQEEEEEITMIKWQLWDWAAWVAVGFPAVCLPFCDSQ